MVPPRRHVLYLTFFLLILFSSESSSDFRDAVVNNEKGVKALDEKNYRKAIEYFRLALQESPGNEIIKNNLSNAYHDYGRTLYKRGETLNAIDNFERSLKYNPKNVYSLIDLGRANYEKNNLERAISYFGQAYEINPGISGLKGLLAKVQSEIAVENRLRKFETMHFIIVSEEDISVDNLASIRISLEQAYSRIGAFFDYFPKQKTPVILYPEAAYKNLAKGSPGWAHAHFDGKIRIPLAKRIYSKDFLSKVIYHEFTHAVIRELTKDNCPMWLDEGLACYAERYVETKHRSFFTQYINKETFVPFNKLPKGYSGIKDARRANLLYREFYLLASFIVEKRGNLVLRNLLTDLGNGMSLEAAMTKNFSVDTGEFGRAWESYVKSKLGF